MIICKPRGRLIRSVAFFLLICYGLVLWLIFRGEFNYLSFLGIALLLLIAIPLNVRMVLRYKFIEAAKGKIEVRYPLMFRKDTFKLSDLQEVNEEQVKTFQDIYKELRMQFSNGKLSLSKQEYSDYERLKAYVDKNKPKKN